MALAIGAYRGEGDDLAELIARSWQSTYRGRAWFPGWDRAYIGWRLMDPRVLDRELMVCAYDGDALVGCLLGEESLLRVGDEVLRGSLTSYLSVDPATTHRGLALRLLDRQRQLHRDRGLLLSVGVSSSGPELESARFWAGVARRRPNEFARLGRYVMWCAVIDGAAVAGAGLTAFERWGSRAASFVPWGWWGARGARTRPFGAGDLDACLDRVNARVERAGVQMIWSRPRLSLQLDHPHARTWVTEEQGRLAGFANGYLIDWFGRQRVRVGYLELFDADGRTSARAALLVAAGRALAAEGAQMVVTMDSGTRPRAALLAAGFMPMDPQVQTLALLGERAATLPTGSRLHCAFT
jgi:hypothetical protein